MSSTPHTAQPHSLEQTRSRAAIQFAALMLVLIGAASFELRNLSSLTAISGNRIWLHLRTGFWILDNHGLPHTGLFSQFADRPWSDATWAFDLLVAVFYKVLDLRALPILLMICRVKLGVLAYLLGGGLRVNLSQAKGSPEKLRFWGALSLTVVVLYAFARIPLNSDYVSILFFSTELFCFGEIRKTGSTRLLYAIPLLFLVWANFDPLFVLGILTLLLFLVILAIGRAWSGANSRVPTLTARHAIFFSALLSIVASCMTPYGYHSYSVFLESFSSVTRSYIPDLHSLGFRQPQDYVLMLLTMSAFLALGLRRSRDPFQLLILTACTVLAFRSQRFTWLAGIAAIAVIGDTLRPQTELLISTQASALRKQIWRVLFAAAASILIVIGTALIALPPSQDALLGVVAKTYPVAACDFIRANHFSSPLFNPIDWGGFLAWYLPDAPVAIDSRAGLYTDEEIVQYFKAMNAEIPYTSYTPMEQANTLLLPRHTAMGEALANVPALRSVYRDDVAVVLIRPRS